MSQLAMTQKTFTLNGMRERTMEKEDECTVAFCPSFSSYTCDLIAETAERVRLEFSDEYNNEFEFVNPRPDCVALSSSSGSEFLFPIFNQVLNSKISAEKSNGDNDESSLVKVTTPLKDLFLRDREDLQPIRAYSSSSSSSDEEEEGELSGISSEIYCPWTPEKSPNGGWRKSKSTGSSSSSSRRWRIKDLLKRSYSEGKQSLNFLNFNSTNRDESSKMMKKKEKVSAHEKFYLRNKAMKEEEKRKSYLPYRQDLVGFLSNLQHRKAKPLPRF